MKIQSIHRTGSASRTGLGLCLSTLCGLIAIANLHGTAHAQELPGSSVRQGLFTHQGHDICCELIQAHMAHAALPLPRKPQQIFRHTFGAQRGFQDDL